MSITRQLSPEAKAEIKSLSGARPQVFLTTILTTWLTIGASIAAALYLDNIFATIFAIYIVATRQNLLALLVHEQTHYLGLKSRFGDWLANILVAYPLLAVSIEGYAKIHLRHHRFYFTDKDPDFHRKNGPEWTFPMAPRKLLMLFLSDLLGISFVRFALNKVQLPEDNAFRRKNPSPVWLKPLFLATLAIILTIVGGWFYFLLFWMLPLLTIFPAIVRWGAICEHVYGHEGVSVEESSPIIVPTFWSKLLLPNLNFAMHPYHHFYPGVSFGNLPAMHRIFEREGLVCQDMVFNGQLAYLRFILSGQSRSAVAHQGATALSEEIAAA